MARQRIEPTYRFHRATGLAIITYYDVDRQRRSILLPGAFNSEESLTEYRRTLAILRTGGTPTRPSQPVASTPLAIDELIDRYWQHVKAYYRRADGTETQEVACMRYSLRPLNFLHGKTLVANFGPSCLKGVRELMILGYLHPEYGPQPRLCRNEVNKRIKRIRRMMKWGVESEIVPSNVLLALQSVAALKRGRTEAYDAPAVTPVARAVVEETLPLLRTTMQDMVMTQLETGMRPGELVTMRACDIDMSGPTWLYRPPQHKTLHHGHDRIIAIGPRGQEIVKRHLGVNTVAPLFSPQRLMEERAAAMRAERKTNALLMLSAQTSFTVILAGCTCLQSATDHEALDVYLERIPADPS